MNNRYRGIRMALTRLNLLQPLRLLAARTVLAALVTIPALLLAPNEVRAQDTAAGPAEMCSDSCRFAGDGECDDGGVGAQYRVCGFGTDCSDCGARNESQRRGLRPQGGLALQKSFRLSLGVALANASHSTVARLRGQRARIPLLADGRAIQLHGRWVGVFRRTALGQQTGLDLRFGVQQFRASVSEDQPNVVGAGIEDGQQRYDLWFEPLFRVDRPIGKAFGLTLSMGPTLSLMGAGVVAEVQPRIVIGRIGIEPRAGIGFSTAIARELRFGGDLSFGVSEKVALSLGYLARLGTIYQEGDHQFAHHSMSLGVGF